MLHSLSIIAAITVLNFIRGRGFIPKPFTSLLSGFAVAGVLYFLEASALLEAGIIGLIVFLGLWLWAGPGWGKYFSAFHGRDNLGEIEIPFIDTVGYELLPRFNSDLTGSQIIRRNRLRGLLCMSMRGMFIFPLFIGLGIYLISPFALLCGVVVGLLQGPAYFVMQYVPEKYAVMLAEILYGILIGVSLALVVL